MGMFLIVLAVLGGTGSSDAGLASPEIKASLSAVADTFVASNRSDQVFGAAEGLWVGYDDDGGYEKERIFIRFDGASIPAGAQIESAQLRLYLGNSTGSDPTMRMTVHRVTEPWEEAALTWNDQIPWVVIGSEATLDVSTAFGWQQWDVTALLWDWMIMPPADGTIGFRLMGDESEGQHERAFWSKDCTVVGCDEKRPLLDVTYTTGRGIWLPLMMNRWPAPPDLPLKGGCAYPRGN